MRIDAAACDHAANFQVRILLVSQFADLCAGEELVMQGIVPDVPMLDAILVGKVDGVAGSLFGHDTGGEEADVVHQAHVDFIESQPQFDDIAKFLEAGLGIMHKAVDGAAVSPAVPLLDEGIRELVVAQGHQRLDALGFQCLKNRAIERHALGVRLLLVAVREQARPVDGHAIALEAHLAEQLDVLEIVMVHVDGLMAGIVDVRLDVRIEGTGRADGAAGHGIGYADALAVLLPAAFTLVGSGRAAPQEIFRELCHNGLPPRIHIYPYIGYTALVGIVHLRIEQKTVKFFADSARRKGRFLRAKRRRKYDFYRQNDEKYP